jgi:hypothetical protein
MMRVITGAALMIIEQPLHSGGLEESARLEARAKDVIREKLFQLGMQCEIVRVSDQRRIPLEIRQDRSMLIEKLVEVFEFVAVIVSRLVSRGRISSR